jgi:hypothetical protein
MVLEGLEHPERMSPLPSMSVARARTEGMYMA